MTDKVKGTLSKVSMTITIIIALITVVATGVRALDLSSRTAVAVDALAIRLETEVRERREGDTFLFEQVRTEKDARKDEYTKIQVKLTELDTKLIYIQQGVDKIGETR